MSRTQRSQTESFVKEIQVPKLSGKFEDAIEQVRPLFAAWAVADKLFEHNTVEIAKAIARTWDLLKAMNPTATKVDFARYFDAKIPEDARVRDVVSNATYNHIQYLIHKVVPATTPDPNREPPVSAAERTKKRVQVLKREWRHLEKTVTAHQLTLDELREAVEKMLKVFLPEETAHQIVA